MTTQGKLSEHWDELLTEHMARRASELGDTEIESLCDRVLAGEDSADRLIDIARNDVDYRAWMERGRESGWAVRS